MRMTNVRFVASPSRVGIGCVLLLAAITLSAADWPNYRGPSHDGVSTERINKDWSGAITNAAWRVVLGNGLTSFSVAGGRAFTQVRRNIGGANREVCLALSVADGAELWARVVDSLATYPDGGVGTTDDGPRSTPAVDGESVYVLSSYLKLLRINATNGSVIWSNDLRVTYGGNVIAWQNAASPVIEQGLIFLNANAGTQRLMALRTSDSSLAWRTLNEAMTHSTPVLTTIHGVRQIIFATQSGLTGLNPQTGELLWRTNYPFTYSTSLAASPVVCGDIVFIAGFYAMGAAAFQIVLTNGSFMPTLLWANPDLEEHWTTLVCVQGHLFGQFTPVYPSYHDNATAPLKCIVAATGEEKWSVTGFGRGAPLLVGNRLLVLTETGELVLTETDTNVFTEVARFQAIPNYHPNTNKCWNALAVAEGKVFVRSTAQAAAFDLALPALKLDPPQLTAGNKLHVTIRTANGTPVDSNRLAQVGVRTSTNSALSPALWPQLTNALTLTNGLIQVTDVDAQALRRFFIVTEPE